MHTVISILKEKIKQGAAIAEGYTRTALNVKTDIMTYREQNYCMKCPLAHKDGRYTGECDKAEGGCGCGVSAKASQNSFGCPKGFWASDWFKPEKFAKFLKENPIKYKS